MRRDPTDSAPPIRLAVIGVGGTGCALLPLLASLPLVSITLIDGDTVEATNLSRQPLYGPGDVGRLKVEVARERLLHLAPSLPIMSVPSFLDTGNAQLLLADHDLVADCTDDLHARLLIDRICGAHGIPLVSGAVHGVQVQVVTLHVGSSTSLRSFFPGRSSAEQDGCDMRRVPASVTAFAGALMAEHILALVNGDRSRAGILELIDTRDGRWLRLAPPVPEQRRELLAERTKSEQA
ncbi:MAG: ThiF family adenylyltransferase [Flavobacteriales bacterium]|nr:ThiF family adenylyltransferase [Flavobacteriales bacterium]